jgi:hypothetical protein
MNGTNLIAALASPPPAPVVSTPILTDGQILIAWTTVSQQSYQLQWTTNLNGGTWSDLGAATNAPGTVAAMSDTVSNAERFYRVVLLP